MKAERYRFNVPLTVAQVAAFWVKVEKTDTCWLWNAARFTIGGYGQFQGYRAHRISYELLVGPIPAGLQLDHLCRVSHCVNPAHLEPVTNRENALRGIGITAMAARKTHCTQGHPLSEGRLTKRGQRRCLVCARRWNREWRKRVKARAA